MRKAFDANGLAFQLGTRCSLLRLFVRRFLRGLGSQLLLPLISERGVGPLDSLLRRLDF